MTDSLFTQQNRTVFLTGATGFLGMEILARLVERGNRVVALVRASDQIEADARIAEVLTTLYGEPDRYSSQVQALAGDVTLPLLGLGEKYTAVAAQVDYVVHCAASISFTLSLSEARAINVNGTRAVIDFARAAQDRGSLDHFIHVSTAFVAGRHRGVFREDQLDVGQTFRNTYEQTKWEGEQLIRGSGLDYTIFRPSIIHGPDGEFMQMVKGFCCNAFPPFMPYFGSGVLGRGGAGRLQPVWVEDVAQCFVAALTTPQAVGETYPLGGPDVFSWPELYTTCHQYLPSAKRRRKPLAVPVWYASLLAGKPGVPFNRDQVIMSQEDSVCQTGKAQEHFGLEFAAFEPTFAGYADQIE